MGSLPLPFTETGDLAVATTSSTLRPSRTALVLRHRHLRPCSARASVPALPGGLLVLVLLLVHGTRIGARTSRNPIPPVTIAKFMNRYAERLKLDGNLQSPPRTHS